MKVHEAIKVLQEADPDAEVFLSSDDEGNSYRKANISFPEIAIDQDGEWVMACGEDIMAGEYEGWEDKMISAVVIW